MGAGLLFNLLRILCSIYRGQNLVLDLSRTELALNFLRRESCPQYRNLSSINQGQVSVLDKSKTRSVLDKSRASSVDMFMIRGHINVFALSKTGSCP